MQSDIFKENSKLTLLKHYGITHPMKSKEIVDKVLNSSYKNQLYMEKRGYIRRIDLIKEYGTGFLSDENIKNKMVKYKDWKYLHKKYVYLIDEYIENIKTRSKFERDVFDYVKSIYDGKIDQNSRKVIPPKELDIFLPDKNVAIECNGLYYHSENFGIPKNYHINKTNLCNKVGVRLIHINERDWDYHKNICKSIIKDSIGIYDNVVKAEDCSIKETCEENSRYFLLNNHLNGYIKSDINIGLYYNKDLVELISLNKLNNNKYELVRHCSLINYKVSNGLNKLLNYITDKIANTIITSVDISKYNLNAYYNIGWELVSFSEPECAFYKNKNKYSQKEYPNLENILSKKNINNNLSYSDNMKNNYFLKIYDCGKANLKYCSNSNNSKVVSIDTKQKENNNNQ